MNSFFAILSVSTASLCAVLCTVLIFFGMGSQQHQNRILQQQEELQKQQQQVQTLQQTLQAQQEKISAGNYLSQQVGPAVLKDLGAVAIQNKNEKIRGLLSKYGVTIKEEAPETTAPAR